MHICILECMGWGPRCHSVSVMLLCHTYRPDWRERNTKQNRGVPCLSGLGRAGEYHACWDWAEPGSTMPVRTGQSWGVPCLLVPSGHSCAPGVKVGVKVSVERVTWNRPL